MLTAFRNFAKSKWAIGLLVLMALALFPLAFLGLSALFLKKQEK